MQRRGNWLHCFIPAHILAPNQQLTWVELLPHLLVLLLTVLLVLVSVVLLVLLTLLSSSLQQHSTRGCIKKGRHRPQLGAMMAKLYGVLRTNPYTRQSN